MCNQLADIHSKAIVDGIRKKLYNQIEGKKNDENLRKDVARALQESISRCIDDTRFTVSVTPKSDKEFIVTINGEN